MCVFDGKYIRATLFDQHVNLIGLLRLFFIIIFFLCAVLPFTVGVVLIPSLFFLWLFHKVGGEFCDFWSNFQLEVGEFEVIAGHEHATSAVACADRTLERSRCTREIWIVQQVRRTSLALKLMGDHEDLEIYREGLEVD